MALDIEKMAFDILLIEIQNSLNKYKSNCGDSKKNISIDVKELKDFNVLGYLY